MPDLNNWSSNSDTDEEERQAKQARRHALATIFAVFCGIWFGWIGSDFEQIMEYLMVVIVIGFMVFAFGSLSTDDGVRDNTQGYFVAVLSLCMTVLVSHYVRLKVSPRTRTD